MPLSWGAVPNAPCGVESIASLRKITLKPVKVPNAPCGVESYTTNRDLGALPLPVPNAPCGVESSQSTLTITILLRKRS